MLLIHIYSGGTLTTISYDVHGLTIIPGFEANVIGGTMIFSCKVSCTLCIICMEKSLCHLSHKLAHFIPSCSSATLLAHSHARCKPWPTTATQVWAIEQWGWGANINALSKMHIVVVNCALTSDEKSL